MGETEQVVSRRVGGHPRQVLRRWARAVEQPDRHEVQVGALKEAETVVGPLPRGPGDRPLDRRGPVQYGGHSCFLYARRGEEDLILDAGPRGVLRANRHTPIRQGRVVADLVPVVMTASL
ncbi:MAG: hypothetical protein FJY88_00920 [Candidatus Eisenbacteria bacterium]|nr:hypothetical protein [Candidatus Eisenbacteria bacterium]